MATNVASFSKTTNQTDLFYGCENICTLGQKGELIGTYPTKPDANVSGVSGWRLSTTDEMSHLFYNELGGVVGSSILSSSDPDLALFTNIQPSGYVSSTYFPPTPDLPQALWGVFNFGNGFQDLAGDVLWINYAWAVHDGDVALIPEPEIYAMMSIGLLAMLGFGRLRQQS